MGAHAYAQELACRQAVAGLLPGCSTVIRACMVRGTMCVVTTVPLGPCSWAVSPGAAACSCTRHACNCCGSCRTKQSCSPRWPPSRLSGRPVNGSCEWLPSPSILSLAMPTQDREGWESKAQKSYCPHLAVTPESMSRTTDDAACIGQSTWGSHTCTAVQNKQE